MLAIVAGLAIVFVLALSVGAIFVLDLLGDETNTRDKAVTPPVDTQEKTTTSSLAEDSSASGYTVPYNEEAARAEAEVEQATRDYHEAVDREDWDYTYENLDSETREMFTEEEWYEKNQWFADHENLELEAIEVDAVMNFGGKEADVTVRRTFEDGTSLTRRTYFVYEDGEWRHRFTDEEKGVFMPDASYEEFVAAQQ